MSSELIAYCERLRSDLFPSGLLAQWLRVDGPVIHVTLPFPAGPGLRALVAQDPMLRSYTWDIQVAVQPLPPERRPELKSAYAKDGSQGPKNVIAVASGKGGVGKSAVTLSLAHALSDMGAKVGILDGDIYGPSLPMMLGNVKERVTFTPNRKMLPVKKYGIEANSLGYLVDEGDATIWRGPMASRALEQLFFDTQWSALDYLLIDMPPGTGDLQLTLAQKLPVTAAVVVTTPQNIALSDAEKGIRMFRKVGVPVVGLIENMSFHACEACGHHNLIFGAGGGDRLAHEESVPVLGHWPLLTEMRAALDEGVPFHQAHPDHPAFAIHQDSAQRLVANAWDLLHDEPVVPE
ncbi:iron-sulfur cluster carrier protein ApbC [Aliidiomarina halalkaliphila]|uniref:Iron-sulfur cluster carrier protein n=1 Tax=Aliidiomarina halalkaliphila TaxID=2593535 RepID=A0A552X3R1_9GAMM|nr:iron-sulfur cluster carrier protein ApbC [Aliidiomarina halalkaliphila]TRW49674.1 iron-sulfur cluster carrier protein ApbC [Aliidiomarina halalkaliphila]